MSRDEITPEQIAVHDAREAREAGAKLREAAGMCPLCGIEHPGGITDFCGRDERFPVYRIEALRAASRIMAGIYAAGSGTTGGAHGATLDLAEQFAKWLEGER